MSSLVKRDKTAVAKRKGTYAVAAAAGAGVAAIAGAPVIAVIGLAGAGYLAWDWLSYRMKHGVRL